jgi:hypothetical protein
MIIGEAEPKMYEQLKYAIHDEDYVAIDNILNTCIIDTNRFGGAVYRYSIITDNIFLMSFMLNHVTQNITQRTLKKLYNMALDHDSINVLYVLNGYIKLKPDGEQQTQ